MPSRSANNHRYVPDAVRDYDLNPAASVVDKQSKYTPQVGDSERLKQTAQGLSRLAKGINDASYVLQKQANEHMVEAVANTEEKNRKDWAEVSKNIDGMAKFNPYNKDAYNALICNDIGKKYINNLYADPELKYRSPEEVDNMINNLQTDMIAEFGKTGISQKYYAKPLLDFKKHSDALSLKHTSEHAEITMQRTDNQISTSYSNVLLEGGEAEFSNTLDTVVLEGNGLGRTIEGNANNVLNTVQKAIVAEPSKFSSAFVLGQLKTYKVNGKPLTEIIPNLEGQVLKMVREAKQADLHDRKIEYESEQFEMQQKRERIATNFVDMLLNNEKMSPTELRQWAIKQCQEEGLDGVNTFKLFNDLANGHVSITDLEKIPSDPDTLFGLQMGIFSGETTTDSIYQAMQEGNLNAIDAAKIGEQLYNFNIKKENKEIKRIDDHIKRTTEEYLKDDDKTNRRAVLRTSAARQELANRMMALRAEYEKGNIDYNQFNNKLAAAKAACKEIERQNRSGQRTGMLAGYESLMATPEISREQWNKVDVYRSTLAFRKMGIIKNSEKQNSKTIYIDSHPQALRPSTGTRHTGYDLGGRDVAGGKAVYCPVAGQVVGVLKGDNGGMGNMVLVRAKNGKMVKFMHLQNTGLPSLGDTITADTVIGHVGTSGKVQEITRIDGTKTKVPSLHMEFYDKDMQWITAWEFVQ